MINQKRRTLLIVLPIALAIGGFLVYSGKINLNKPQTYPSPVTQSSPTNSTKTFTLGTFTLSIPSTELTDKNKTDSYYGQVKQSKLTDYEGASIDGLNSLSLEKFNPQSKSGLLAYMIVNEWNNKDLKFKSPEDEIKFHKKVDELTTLSNYQDELKLRSVNLANWENRNTVNEENFVPSLNSMACAIGCIGGGWNIPFLIKKIDTTKFDLAYFAEVSGGNGDIFNYPNRTLIVNKNGNWLMLRDDQRLDETDDKGKLNPFPGCPINTTVEALKCSMELWATKYRNGEENQKWIQKMLDGVTYTR